MEKRANLRRHAMKELLDTEKTYVGLLRTLIHVFVDPLSEKPELLIFFMSRMRLPIDDIFHVAAIHDENKIQNGVRYDGKTRYELSAAVWIPDDWSDCCMVKDCKTKI